MCIIGYERFAEITTETERLFDFARLVILREEIDDRVEQAD